MFSALRCGRSITARHNIDVTSYIIRFFNEFLAGSSIKKYLRPKMIISGNDNGCPVIKSKAAAPEILLIQNGERNYSSDSSFKYSDYYVSMGTGKYVEARQKTGNIFKNVLPYGSLRLHNFVKASSGDPRKSSRLYDIVWISNWNLVKHADIYRSFYPIEAEYSAIRLINQISSLYNVAYYGRYQGETEDLKKLGLFSENVAYIRREDKSVYESIQESEIVLSTGSTVNLEAMALGKKVGFVNLSGNPYINYTYKDLSIEYNNVSSIPFADFISGIRARTSRYEEFISQNTDFVRDLCSAIKQNINE